THPRLDDAFPTCAPQALHRVQGAGLTLGIVIPLFRQVVLELEVMVLKRGEVQGETGIPVLRRDYLLVTETASILEQAAVAVDQTANAVTGIALIPIIETGPQAQADQTGHQRAAGIHIGLAVITELGVFLKG